MGTPAAPLGIVQGGGGGGGGGAGGAAFGPPRRGPPAEASGGELGRGARFCRLGGWEVPGFRFGTKVVGEIRARGDNLMGIYSVHGRHVRRECSGLGATDRVSGMSGSRESERTRDGTRVPVQTPSSTRVRLSTSRRS
ncbi:hypothetical protein NL676_010487 [Syzygium grande]|nr:hypothetical protein NL676_010487 [Syzygium grande]